jgi:hypothetical protein
MTLVRYNWIFQSSRKFVNLRSSTRILWMTLTVSRDLWSGRNKDLGTRLLNMRDCLPLFFCQQLPTPGILLRWLFIIELPAAEIYSPLAYSIKNKDTLHIDPMSLCIFHVGPDYSISDSLEPELKLYPYVHFACWFSCLPGQNSSSR